MTDDKNDLPTEHWCDECGASLGLMHPSEVEQERIDTPDGHMLICKQCREDNCQAMWIARYALP